jgi:fatty acid desaturase
VGPVTTVAGSEREAAEAQARRLVAAEHLARPRTLASAGHLAVAWCAGAALAVLVVRVPSLLVRLPAWWAMAWLLVGNGAVAHECVHGHLFASRRASRLVGTVAAASLLLPWSAYRAFHLEHHAHTASAGDPEGTPLTFGSFGQYLVTVLSIGPGFLALLWADACRVAVGRSARRGDRWAAGDRTLTRWTVASAAVLLPVAALVAATHWRVLLVAWVAPLALALLVCLPAVLVPEHAGAEPSADPLLVTRTVRSSRLLRWAYWQNNRHAAHHLLPAAVPQAMGSLDAVLAPVAPEGWAARGYARWHLATAAGLLRRGAARP